MLLSLVDFVIDILFAVIPNLPMIDNAILTALDNYVNLIFNHLELLGFFIRIDTIKMILPWLIIVINFDHLYYLALWILKKLPIIHIE